MKKIFFTLSLLVLALSLYSAQTLAQAKPIVTTQATLVATVNIYNATNTKINANSYRISFKLDNREGVQGDIRYGLELSEKETGKVVDLDLVNEALTLGVNSSKDITLDYTLPNFIANGIYKLLIIAKNSSGLPLATSPIGFPEEFITIENNSSQNFSLTNCSLSVNGKTFATNQLANLESGENLTATCHLANLNNLGNAKLQLVTHQASQAGDILSNQILNKNSFTLDKNNQTITFKITTLPTPQNYELDTFFINSQGEKVSPSNYLHYMVRGISATIQNTVLDKADYKQGEIAKFKLFWNLINTSTNASSSQSSYSAKVKILDKTNSLCGESAKNLKSETLFNETSFNIEITQACSQAKATVEILDEQGRVLAQSEIDLNTPSKTIQVNPDLPNQTTLGSNINKFYVVVFVMILVLLGYGILVFKKMNHQK